MVLEEEAAGRVFLCLLYDTLRLKKQPAGISVLTPRPGGLVCAHLRSASGALAGDFAAWAT